MKEWGNKSQQVPHEIIFKFLHSMFVKNIRNMVNWWSDKDKEMFTSLATEIDVLYSSLEPLPGMKRC